MRRRASGQHAAARAHPPQPGRARRRASRRHAPTRAKRSKRTDDERAEANRQRALDRATTRAARLAALQGTYDTLEDAIAHASHSDGDRTELEEYAECATLVKQDLMTYANVPDVEAEVEFSFHTYTDCRATPQE